MPQRFTIQRHRPAFRSIRYSKHTSTTQTNTSNVQECNSLLNLQAVPEGQNQDDMVGCPIMHLSALKQATGEAVYCDDVPLYQNELYLALITSTKAHARIL